LRSVKADRGNLSKSGFDMGEDIEGLGGFVLESKDGSSMLDFRFDMILEEAWKSSLAEINKILFNE
jgi:vacuolar-type H+-ATPase subunit E/Vma4